MGQGCRDDGRRKGRGFSTMDYLLIYYTVDTCLRRLIAIRSCWTAGEMEIRVREFDFFVRPLDGLFCGDKERVSTLISLYQQL